MTLDLVLSACLAGSLWGVFRHVRGGRPGRGVDSRSDLLLPTVRVSLDLLAGVVATGIAWQAFGCPIRMAAPIGGLAAALVHLWQASRRARQAELLEVALADLIDLTVGTLRAGGGVVEGLTRASAESPRRLRDLLRDVLERIRLGDDPVQAIDDLSEAVPLQTYKIFGFTLQAHWQSGGGLAETLSGVARSIRERVAVARRVRTQALETQVSAVGVLVITFGLAVLMWRSDPARMENFLSSDIGQMAAGFAISLQAIGLVWIYQMTRIEV